MGFSHLIGAETCAAELAGRVIALGRRKRRTLSHRTTDGVKKACQDLLRSRCHGGRRVIRGSGLLTEDVRGNHARGAQAGFVRASLSCSAERISLDVLKTRIYLHSVASIAGLLRCAAREEPGTSRCAVARNATSLPTLASASTRRRSRQSAPVSSATGRLGIVATSRVARSMAWCGQGHEKQTLRIHELRKRHGATVERLTLKALHGGVGALRATTMISHLDVTHEKTEGIVRWI